ncbi:MAG: IS66 family insertion sequence element accessory protein TnpB [Lachnospiraceae bacterium]
MEKIYLRTGYTDMRKQLDGLVDIIQYSFRLDPYSNSLFLFCGKRADRIKAVHYKGDGFCLFYKRYENGRLKWPRTGEEARQIFHQQLRWLLEGLNPEQPKAVRKRAPQKPGNSL